MIKLLIKQGPFYIASFTSLLLAMHQTGLMDRLFPLQEISADIEAPAPMIGSAVECNADGECTESFMLGDLDFVPGGDTAFYQEWWFILLAFIIGGLLLGWLLRKIWEFVEDEVF